MNGRHEHEPHQHESHEHEPRGHHPSDDEPRGRQPHDGGRVHGQDDEDHGESGPGWRRRGPGPFGRGRARGMGPGLGGGPRGRRRGDIRWALLGELAESAGHGYELIQRLDERTGGRWTPSPGSVYPTLQLLDEEGLVRSAEVDGKRVYTITEAGQAALAERRATPGGMPPFLEGQHSSHGELRRSAMQLMMAAKQVGMAGKDEHLASATAILDEARRKLYQLLAEG